MKRVSAACFTCFLALSLNTGCLAILFFLLLTARWINENTHLHYLQHFSFIFLDTPVQFLLIISFLRNSIPWFASKDPNYREPGGGKEQKEAKCNYQIIWWIAGKRYLETCTSSGTGSKDSMSSSA